ncbi:MAG: hypothetical protein PHG66_00690 [Candidatus Colwellbacteria bacterium]|nr:hypothetical protein [Candidatus Colwellbacteria bacterium]
MSKKVRKKKEIENETYDILQLDEKIKKLIQEETKKLDQYRERMSKIKEELEFDGYDRISYRQRKDLETEIETLTKKIEDLETNNMFAEYICISQKIIGEYMKLIVVPMNVSFFGGKSSVSNVDNAKKENLLEKFLDVAKKYIPIKTFKKEVQRKHSCICGNTTEFTQTDNTITCDECGIEKNIYTIHTNFKDVDRVNLSQKYKYNKKTHFRDTMNQYQGKQNKKIETRVYSDCERWFDKHNLLTDVPSQQGLSETEIFHKRHSKITKGLIDMALSETENTSNYEDVNLIHNYFTGIPCPDISHIESELNDDFDKVADAYETLKDVDRTNFLNGQYVLYQLLRRRKEKVDEADFHKLKTRERLIEHDELFSRICLINEWSFKPMI